MINKVKLCMLFFNLFFILRQKANLANAKQVVHVASQLLEFIWISYSFPKWRFSCSCRFPKSCWLLGPTTISIFWTHILIFFHTHAFLVPVLKIHTNSTMGVQIIVVLNLGSFTLCKYQVSLYPQCNKTACYLHTRTPSHPYTW